MSTPSHKNLSLIEWTDEGGNLCKFKLIDKISSKWSDAGTLLGLGDNELQNIGEERTKNKHRFEEVHKHWEDNGSSDYPFTWEGLFKLLQDIEKSRAARELREFLEEIGFDF